MLRNSRGLMSNIKFEASADTHMLIPPWFTERWELIGNLVIGLFEKLEKLMRAIPQRFIERKM